MKLDKTLSTGAKLHSKDKYTKLFQEIFCKIVEFIELFFALSIKLYYSFKNLKKIDSIWPKLYLYLNH